MLLLFLGLMFGRNFLFLFLGLLGLCLLRFRLGGGNLMFWICLFLLVLFVLLWFFFRLLLRSLFLLFLGLLLLYFLGLGSPRLKISRYVC